MLELIFATKLSAAERSCLFKLENQMVRQQGYINRSAFVGDLDSVFVTWQQQGHIKLNADEMKHVPPEMIKKYQLTHSCNLSEALWLASSSLRRIYACDL